MADNKKTITVDSKKQEIKKEIHLVGKEWKDLCSQAKKEIAKTLKVDGYRPGHIPENIVNQKVSIADIVSKVVELKNHDWTKEAFDEAKKENKNTLPVPHLEINAFSEDEFSGAIVFPLSNDLSKLDFKKLGIKYSEVKPTDKDVEEMIQKTLEQQALLLPLKDNEKTQNGDTVKINYKGFIGDEPFEGGEANNYDLKLGSMTFIEGFEEQLMDKKTGWKGEINVNFPKNYGVTKLANKKATFEVEIVEAKRPEKVELTEDKLNLFRAYGVKTVKELKANLALKNKYSKLLEGMENFLDDVISKAYEKNDFEVNDVFLEERIKNSKQKVIDNLKKNKIKYNEYLQLLGQTDEQFMKVIKETEAKEAKRGFIINELVSRYKEAVKLNDDDINFFKNAMGLTLGFPYSILEQFLFNNKEQFEERLQPEMKDIILKELILKDLDKAGYDKYIKVKKELGKEIETAVKAIKAFEEKEKKESEEKIKAAQADKKDQVENKEDKNEAPKAKKESTKKTSKSTK